MKNVKNNAPSSNPIDDVIGTIIRIITTPIIFIVMLLLLFVYLTFGTAFWMVMFIRLLTIFNIKILRSIWTQTNDSAQTMQNMIAFTKQHFYLAYEIIKIPIYVWQSPRANPTQLRDILEDEIHIFRENIWVTISVFASLIIGAAFIFTSLGEIVKEKLRKQNQDFQKNKIEMPVPPSTNQPRNPKTKPGY